MSLKRIAVLIVTGLVVLILQQPLKLTGGAGVSGSSGTVLLAQSRPPTIAKLASDARKFSVKVPGGHLLGASANPAYTYAMSDGSPAPKLVTGPDGELYLGYNDADSNARVVLLGENFRIERSIVQIKGKRLEDFVADDDGVALLLTEFDSEQKQNYISRQHHTAHIEKFTSKGRAIFRTRIVGTREYKQEGDQGIDTTFGTFSIVHDASEDTYATYFSTYRRWDDGITHQSEYLALFDGDHGERRMRSDRANPEGFTWNVSHSFRPRFVHDGERFVMATVGDAYPRGFVVQFFPQGKRELPVKVPKAKPGETYQYVPVSTGDLYARDEQTWIVFDSAVGKSDYDIALALVEGDSVGKPIYLTNTNRSRERIPRIVPFGREHFLVLWMNDSGPAKQKWHPNLKTMATEGAIIDTRGRVISKPAAFGAQGRFALRSAARLFRLPGGQVGWINDATGVADQLELVLLPGPTGGLDDASDINDPDETPEPPPEDNEGVDAVKIDPKLNQPLLEAIYDGKDDEARALIKRGADPNANFGQWTALLYAAYFGRTAVVQDLVARKANPNATISGWTALRLAESRGHDVIVNILRPITKINSRAFGREAAPSRPGASGKKNRGAGINVAPGSRGKLRDLGRPKQSGRVD